MKADLTRLVVRTLLQELKRQVLENVVHTDFDADVSTERYLAQIARLPAQVLLGLELTENREPVVLAEPAARDRDRAWPARSAVSWTWGFTMISVSDTTELLNRVARRSYASTGTCSSSSTAILPRSSRSTPSPTKSRTRRAAGR